MKNRKRYALLITLLLSHSLLLADQAGPSQAEMEAWFNDDAEMRIDEVNEGALQFLPGMALKQSHKSQAENKIRILPTSLQDGWVEMSQCHRHLDAMPLVQLVFPEYTLRQLRITHQQGIGEAVVEDRSIQMADVSHDASLCVSMQIKALKKNASGQYVLSNGPYQRRFLDGYYPVRLALDIEYSQSGLTMVAISPEQQPGFVLHQDKQHIRLDAYFEGVLRTRVVFEAS